MDGVDALLSVVAGLLLRIGMPLAVTALLVWLLKRLDARWEAEAQAGRVAAPVAPSVACWVTRNCSAAAREACPAYARRDSPCWQVFREQTGRLRSGCVDCEVFQTAPAWAGD